MPRQIAKQRHLVRHGALRRGRSPARPGRGRRRPPRRARASPKRAGSMSPPPVRTSPSSRCQSAAWTSGVKWGVSSTGMPPARLHGSDVRAVDVGPLGDLVDGDRGGDADQGRRHEAQPSPSRYDGAIMSRRRSPGDDTMSLDSASSQRPRARPPSDLDRPDDRHPLGRRRRPLARRRGRRPRAAAREATPSTPASRPGFTLGVVHPDMVSVAGVAPILVHLARTGETWQVSGVGPYPRASTREYFMQRHGGQIPRRAAAHRGAGGARCVVHRARALGDDVLRRRHRAGPRPRRARLRRLRLLRLPDGRQRRQVPAAGRRSAALYLRDGPRLPHGRGARAARAGRHARAHGRGREACGRLARDGHPRGARRVLPRRDGQAHRRVPPRQRGPAGAEPTSPTSAWRSRRRCGRAFGAYEVAVCGFWCQGPVLLQMLNMLDGLDLARARPQLAGVPASPRRDDQARLRRSRRLLRRPELREGARRAAAVEGVRARSGAR